MLQEIVVREAGCLSPNIGAGLRFTVIEHVLQYLEPDLNRALPDLNHPTHQRQQCLHQMKGIKLIAQTTAHASFYCIKNFVYTDKLLHGLQKNVCHNCNVQKVNMTRFL